MYAIYLAQWFCITVLTIQCLFVKEFDGWKLKNNFFNQNNKVEHKTYLHPEFFGILHRLEDYSYWARKEELFVKVAKRRLILVRDEIKLMEGYLEDFEESSGKALRNIQNHIPSSTSDERSTVIASSSVLAHRMLHRYTSGVEHIKNMIGSQYYQDVNDFLRMALELRESNMDKFSSIFQNDMWIGHDDLFMSISALLKNQEIYGLKPNDFTYDADTHDTFASKTTHSVGLSLKELLEIGMFALYRQKYYLAVDWFDMLSNQTTNKTAGHEDIPELTWSKYEDFIALLLLVGIQQHNRQKSKFADDETDNDTRSLNYFVNSIRKHTSQHSRTSFRDYMLNYNSVPKKQSSHLEHHIQFMKLCQGKFYQSPKHTAVLKCFYESKLHPYLFICPVKVEQLSESPPITQYYEVLGCDTIENVLNNNLGYMALMPPELEKLMPGVNAIEVDDRDRTSSGIGLEFQNLPRKIFTTAEIITGFNIWNESDIATFAEYTYGRFYTYHGDVHENDDKNREITDVPKLKNNVGDDMDRMGTMLYYLEEPEIGGDTPFFQAGIVARPVKGSAVIWYNFYRNGTIRKDVYHGACPVIHGNKIMMHHWIRNKSNWNRRKCSLRQDD